MKNLLLIACISFFAFASCDGRQTKKDSLKKAVVKFKDSVKPTTVVKYKPEMYAEVLTDTILSNGYSVSVKTYTDMQNSVTHNYQIDDFNMVKDIYRKWISEVTITKDNIIIFRETIDEQFLNKENKLKADKSLLNSISIGVEVDEELSLTNNEIYLHTAILYPKEEKQILYILKINDKGYSVLKELNTFYKTT